MNETPDLKITYNGGTSTGAVPAQKQLLAVTWGSQHLDVKPDYQIVALSGQVIQVFAPEYMPTFVEYYPILIIADDQIWAIPGQSEHLAAALKVYWASQMPVRYTKGGPPAPTAQTFTVADRVVITSGNQLLLYQPEKLALMRETVPVNFGLGAWNLLNDDSNKVGFQSEPYKDDEGNFVTKTIIVTPSTYAVLITPVR